MIFAAKFTKFQQIRDYKSGPTGAKQPGDNKIQVGLCTINGISL
jgi:hypothetical protein